MPRLVPISPKTPDAAQFDTAPLLVKRVKFSILPKTSTAGAGVQTPKQFIGMVTGPAGIPTTLPAPIVIAPSEVNILPSMLQFIPKVMAPGCESKVPFRLLDAPTEIAPSAIQKTLAARVPLLNIIFEPTPAVNAPSNFIMNTASGSPPPSRVRVPPIDPAPAME